MITTLSGDPRKTNTQNLTTSYQTVVDCDLQEVKTVESICISCGDTGTDVWLVFTNGANDFPIWNKVAMDANTTEFITDFHLRLGYRKDIDTGQKLRAKAAAADLVTVIAITIDAVPVKEAKTAQGQTGGAMIGWRGA